MSDEQLGPYVLEHCIGDGGMGRVHKGLHRESGEPVAIKILHQELSHDPEMVERFLREGRAASRVDHPGVVKILDTGVTDKGLPYLVMEYLQGQSLATHLRERGRLPLWEAMRITQELAAALAAAHARQVIHRDLKPENVIIIPDIEAPKNERTKLLDFGIAKLAPEIKGKVRTVTNVMMGTPTYMSPEQCRGSRNITDRTDVYALGVMLYEMLAGRTPFICEEPGEYLGRHMYEKPPPLQTVVPEVSLVMHWLVDSMLLKEPEARPPMAAVAQALKAAGKLKRELLALREFADSADSLPSAASSTSSIPTASAAPNSPTSSSNRG